MFPPLNDQDHFWGSPDAAIVLLKYGDYQCPRSAQAHRTLHDLQQRLASGAQRDREDLGLVFRHFPRPQIHPQSQKAAETAEAAAAQGKFWQMHNKLFECYPALSDSDLVEYAVQLELDMQRFLQELADHIHAERVQSDIASGQAYGVTDTPTFFIRIRHEECEALEPILATLLDVISNKRNAQETDI